MKIFLHISPGEQIRRFKDRVTNSLKRWKLSYEDFRNRERWADYEVAIEDMMEETSTKRAPWHLVPANDKPFGRLAAFKILLARLAREQAWSRGHSIRKSLAWQRSCSTPRDQELFVDVWRHSGDRQFRGMQASMEAVSRSRP